MPYIKQEDRPQFDKILENLPKLSTKKELKYCIVKLMLIFLNAKEYKHIPPGFSIERYAQFDGILDTIPEIKVKGDLEYCVYSLMILYMASREYRYSNLHDTVYAAIDCGHEFKEWGKTRFLQIMHEENPIRETYDNLFEKFDNAAYAVIHCGDEFRRNLLDKREDQAKEENGDISERFSRISR